LNVAYRIRCSLLVSSSVCQWVHRNSPGFNPITRRRSSVHLNKVDKKYAQRAAYTEKNIYLNVLLLKKNIIWHLRSQLETYFVSVFNLSFLKNVPRWNLVYFRIPGWGGFLFQALELSHLHPRFWDDLSLTCKQQIRLQTIASFW
jgi:hypothetical protein